MTDFTVTDLRRANAGSDAGSLRIELLLYTLSPPRDYETWVGSVHLALKVVSQQMVRLCHQYQELNEDEISARLVHNLELLGLDAAFDAVTGGHCDITVKFTDRYLWLGEAKIAGGMSWLWKGFQQLTTRYATGQPGENRGALLVYSYSPRIDDIMASWKETIHTELPDAPITDSDLCVGAFFCETVAEGTGQPLHTLNFAVPLYFKPKDTDAKLCKPRGRRPAKKSARQA